MTTAKQIFARIKRSDATLEDRREYSVADLARMYALDSNEAQRLHEMIQNQFKTDNTLWQSKGMAD
jgi:hypothetical protein